MTKQPTIPDRIVHVAVTLFSCQGYHGTSTREIARLAATSEVTLYRHFQDKEAIFWSALESILIEVQPRLSVLKTGLKGDPPEVVLPQIISAFADAITVAPELIRLIAIALVEHGRKTTEVLRRHLWAPLSAISDYLHDKAQRGLIRNCDPAILTVAIGISLMVQPELCRLVGEGELSRLESGRLLENYQKFWLDVLIPSGQERYHHWPRNNRDTTGITSGTSECRSNCNPVDAPQSVVPTP